MNAELNEDGFSTFRTGKHLNDMSLDDIKQLESHIQNKISNLLSMSDFDPENSNHKLQMSELKADRDRIRAKKQELSGGGGSSTKETASPEEPKSSQAPEPKPPVSNPPATQDLAPSTETAPSRPSHNLDAGAIDGDFEDIKEPPPQRRKVKRTPSPDGGPPTPEQAAKKAKLLSGRNMLGGAFVGYDIYSRMKEGEGAVSATAKALATNALFAALPGGIVGGIALTAGVAVASMAPELYDTMEAKKAELGRTNESFNTTFEESEGQIANRQQGMVQQRQAEQYALDRMRRHAQSAHSTY